MTIIPFPLQPTIQQPTIQYQWSDYTRLGKANVVSMLDAQGFDYDPNTNYFKLCSLLFQAQKVEVPVTPAIDLYQVKMEKAERRLKIAQERLDVANNPIERFRAMGEVFEAKAALYTI